MVKLPNFTSKAFLAPMAGVSDPALRLICKELGAGLVVTEFINIHAIVAKQDDITKFVEFSEEERPLSIQLFGSDLEKLKLAVKIVESHFDIIDYNMGCPAPHITQQMACSNSQNFSDHGASDEETGNSKNPGRSAENG
jgi:tRNA-dihydrouridine synthase B